MSGSFKARKRQDDWATTAGRGASSTSPYEYKIYADALGTFDTGDETEFQKSPHQRVSQLQFHFYQVRRTAFFSSTRRILDRFNRHATALLAVFIRLIYDGKNQISRPPGSTLLAVADFLYSKKTVEEIVAPLIADLQFEYNEALLAGRKYKAIWVRVRGGWSFLKTLGVYSVLRTFVEIWRKVISA